MIRMLYMLPMLLGRTFDVNKNEVGVDIFPPETVANPRIGEEYFYKSRFKTVETSSDVKDVLEVHGDLSLGIKAGMVTFRGMGSYIKDSVNTQNIVDILTKVSFRTVSMTLPHSAKPSPSWFKTGSQYLGTHFVRSIIYGGDLIACIRFKAAKSESLQHIRAVVKASLESGSALDLVGEGKLESLDKRLEKNATMEINYYATVPLEGVPNTIPGLRELVKNFELHVVKVNNGFGVPAEVELEELSSLNPGFSYLKNVALETELQFFEENFDDLLLTKNRLKSWVKTLPDTLTEKQEKLVSDFSDRLSTIIGKFVETVANLDMQGDIKQLDKAKDAYKEKSGLAMAGKFTRELKKLMKKIVVSNDKQEDKGSALYIHYGSSKCSDEDHTTTLHSGYTSSSSRNASGAGFNYLCLPKDPNTSLQEGTVAQDEGSPVAGVKYGLLENRPFPVSDAVMLRGVVCAVCLVRRRQSIFTSFGDGACPEGWTLQYSGYVMSSQDQGRSQHVCVDSRLESNQDNDSGPLDQGVNFAVLDETGTEDGREGTRRRFLPCAICTK